MKKYELIVGHIIHEIETNRITPGKKLPSVRSMAEYFSCSKSTVIKAYEELEKEHKAFSLKNRGYYLVKGKAGPDIRNENIIDFTSVMPGEGLIPYRIFQHCLYEAMKMPDESLSSFTDPQGTEALRKVIARQLQDSQIFIRHQDIFTVSGTQQAINILGSMPFPDNKQRIMMEQPSYHGALQAFLLTNNTVIGVNRDHRGLDFNELERLFKQGNIKFFYTAPRYSNPLGLSLSCGEKRHLVKLAHKYDVYIVEDDYIGDLETGTRKEAIYSYDEYSKVIYLKSFSKTFLPGIRIGIAIIPEKLQKAFLERKTWSDLYSSALTEKVLEIGISSGMYEDHCNKLKKAYQARLALMRKICEAETEKTLEFNIPNGGIFASVKLKDCINSKRITSSLKRDRILVDDTELCYLKDFSGNPFLILSIAAVKEECMEKACSRIIQTI